jgi:hypothetical protein
MLTLTGLSPGAAGNYHVVINNDTTSATSATATLTVLDVSVTIQPEILYAFLGGSATFQSVVSGATPTGYQWDNNGELIAGATNATFTFLNAQISNTLGQYYVTAKFPFGQSRSPAASFVVLSSIDEVFLGIDPSYQAIAAGASGSITSLVYGPLPTTFQWFKSNTPLAGATNAILTLNPVQESDSGDYTYTVTYPQGSLTNPTPSTLVVYFVESPVFGGGRFTDPNNFTLTFTGLTNRSYQVEYTTNLTSPITWEFYDSLTVTTNPASYAVFVPFLPPAPQYFFRLKILPP